MHPIADFDDVETLARFCAELVRQAIMFNVTARGDGWRVFMTGF